MTKCLLNTKSHDNTQRTGIKWIFHFTNSKDERRIEKRVVEEWKSHRRSDLMNVNCVYAPGENVIGHLFQPKVLFTIFCYHQKWITSRSTLALPMNFPSTLLYLFHFFSALTLLFAKVSFNSFGLSSIFRFATFRHPLPFASAAPFCSSGVFFCVVCG